MALDEDQEKSLISLEARVTVDKIENCSDDQIDNINDRKQMLFAN